MRICKKLFGKGRITVICCFTAQQSRAKGKYTRSNRTVKIYNNAKAYEQGHVMNSDDDTVH